ncbi:MAG: 50S ribosomal protein L4 [Alphaproteobacteria bacterium]
MKLEVKNLENKSVGSIELSDSIFGVDIREDILARVVNWQLAKRRSGCHKAKARSEVSGTSKKAFKQKGGGRSRHGNMKAPSMVGGGVAFGPVVRDHGYSLQKKVRRLGLKTALSSKAKQGKLLVLDSVATEKAKTKEVVAKIKALGLTSALIVDGIAVDNNFALAARNIIGIDVLPQQGANVYDILRRDTLVLTKEAVEHLEARLK